MSSPEVGENFPTSPGTASPESVALTDEEFGGLELSPEFCAELLDPKAWSQTLETYARTTKLAVAITDLEGRLLGTCYNAQPFWLLAHRDTSPGSSACSFCLSPSSPCTSVPDAIRTGELVIVSDRVGLSHLALPVSLCGRRIGALIAGQVLARYPESLPLKRFAAERGISRERLLKEARRQVPVSARTLRIYGELLKSLGQAFLRQLYWAILDRKLSEANRCYRLFIEGVKGSALFTVSLDGRIASWNAGAERVLGYTEADIVGQDFSRLFTPEDIQLGIPQREVRLAARQGSARCEGWRVRKDRTRFMCGGMLASLGHGNGHELGNLIHDVTDLQKSEDVLLQVQKLQALGVLAGGLAHDFNNVFMGIMANATLIRDELPGSSVATWAEVILNASRQSGQLTRQMLNYAGEGQFAAKRLGLNLLIKHMALLFRASIFNGMELRLNLDASLPPIHADAGQILQLVTNLVLNGAEAIGLEGTITLSTCLQKVGEPVHENVTGETLPPGVYAMLEVRDTGSGMDEATRLRVFDRDFTTKSTGRGLGLAAVLGIVRRHKGGISVFSQPGKGTALRVFLPVERDSDG